MLRDSLPAQDVERHDVEAVNAPAKRPLYAKPPKIYPKRATGTYRQLKWIIMAVTLGIYYLTPWLRWDRGPYAPDQAVLVDIANRRFYFFVIEIWPQEFYYVAGLLIMAGIGLFLVTTVVGRAWCGYTCPQTVWTDLFLFVERWVEGDRNARIKLDAAAWSYDKLRKRAVKNILWLLIAVGTGGAWVFYFADAPTLLSSLVTGTAAPIAYMSIAVLTATTFVLAGYMREQVCIYMCPWPRIQGAMLDEDSLVVTYNDWRGEPRSGHRKRVTAGAPVGDCVDCNACVAVCPMGIDIRDGQQLACITCALCIDACNGVMEKIGKPRGLISYSTLATYNTRMAGKEAHINWRTVLRPRTVIYSSLWALIGLAMLFALSTRDRLDVGVVPDRNPLFVMLSDGSVRNGFTVKVSNMEARPRRFELEIQGLEGAVLSATDIDPANGKLEVAVEPDKLKAVKVFVTAPKSALHGETTDFRFVLTEIAPGEKAESKTYDAIFHGPLP
jgi:cytochrome c oxidase accessory protein FixG